MIWAFNLDPVTTSVVAILGTAVVAELLTHTCSALYQAHERLVFYPIVIGTQRFFTAIDELLRCHSAPGLSKSQ